MIQGQEDTMNDNENKAVALKEEELLQVSGGKKGPRPVPVVLVSNNALTITLDTDNHLLVRCNASVSGFGIGGNGLGLFMAGSGWLDETIRSGSPLTVPGTYSYDYSTNDGNKGNGSFTVTLFAVN